MLVHNEKALLLADKLYELQKQYIKDALLSQNAKQLQIQFIDQVFQHAERIQLHQVVKLDQLIGVVQEQVYKINLAPPLLSVIGEIAQYIHSQMSQNTAPLSSFISDQQVEHWIRKILEMDSVFDFMQDKIQNTPQIRVICAYWINQNIERYAPEKLSLFTERTSAKLPPKVQLYFNQQLHKLEEKLEEKTAHLFQQQLLYLFDLPKDEYLSLALSVWQHIKQQSISEFAQHMTAIDSEEFFILSYEYWKDLRHNPQVQALIHNSIEYFYRAFADESLLYLFHATGLKISDIHLEAQRFAPDILERLERMGVLDQFITQFVQPFFHNDMTLKIIEDHL